MMKSQSLCVTSLEAIQNLKYRQIFTPRADLVDQYLKQVASDLYPKMPLLTSFSHIHYASEILGHTFA